VTKLCNLQLGNVLWLMTSCWVRWGLDDLLPKSCWYCLILLNNW
jgi:hypothetical protein